MVHPHYVSTNASIISHDRCVHRQQDFFIISPALNMYGVAVSRCNWGQNRGYEYVIASYAILQDVVTYSCPRYTRLAHYSLGKYDAKNRTQTLCNALKTVLVRHLFGSSLVTVVTDILQSIAAHFKTLFLIKTLIFLAATKQLKEHLFLSVCLSVCPSVCLPHHFNYVSVIVLSRNFQELLPMTEVMSMQKVKVIGQRSRSQRS